MEKNLGKDFIKYYQSLHPTSTSSKIEGFFNYTNPTIIEERELHVTQMDVVSRLMMERKILFNTEVNADTASILVAQLLYLDSVDNKDIQILIDSPGGSVYDGYGILDAMRLVSSKVGTLCTGMAASMGAMILMCGNKGLRQMLPLSRCMIHQPLGGCKGQATEILNEAREIEKLRNELYEIIAQRSGQLLTKVAQDCERDYWMTAKETKAYGIIDSIVGESSDKPLSWDK